MKEGTVIKAKDGHYYRIRYRETGCYHAEDAGLWRCLRVTWDGDHFGIHDDDDYMLTDDGQVVAREIGWCLRREDICQN